MRIKHLTGNQTGMIEDVDQTLAENLLVSGQAQLAPVVVAVAAAGADGKPVKRAKKVVAKAKATKPAPKRKAKR